MNTNQAGLLLYIPQDIHSWLTDFNVSESTLVGPGHGPPVMDGGEHAARTTLVETLLLTGASPPLAQAGSAPSAQAQLLDVHFGSWGTALDPFSIQAVLPPGHCHVWRPLWLSRCG